MERFGLSDKTKEELIDIILSKNSAEESMSAELTATSLELKKAKGDRDNLSRVCCELSIMLIIFMIIVAYLVLSR